MFDLKTVCLLCKLAKLISQRYASTVETRDNTADYIILKTTQYMEENYASKITVDDLSKIANMSTSNFFRYFKNVFNTSPMEYLKNPHCSRHRHAFVNGQTDIFYSAGMRILRSVAFYQYIQTVHEYETERISSEIPEPKQIVFYNGINPMSALSIITMFPANTLFLLLLIVTTGVLSSFVSY